MRYELWVADHRFIMGKKIRTYKSLESALKRAKKETNYQFTEKNKDIIYLDNENKTPVGLIKIIKD